LICHIEAGCGFGWVRQAASETKAVSCFAFLPSLVLTDA
jgi:hypothetical protein